MNDQQFFNSFHFTKLVFSKEHHTDCSKAPGALKNYIGMIINGSVKLVMKDKTLIFRENEPFFIPLGCKYHSYWYPENGEVCWHSLGFEFLPLRNGKKPTVQKLFFNKSAMNYFERIVSDHSVNSCSIGALYILLGELENKFEYINSPISPVAESALEAINANPFQSIGMVAEKCGVSESSLYGAFKTSLGYSPNFARQKVICEMAIQLLETTNLSVEAVSEKLGFSSSSYFRKVLRLHTGLTPREVRKMSPI